MIEVFVQTEGTTSDQPGTSNTYPLTYTEAWNEDGSMKSKATREVGTRFRIVENGDSITYRFVHTKLERWISIEPPKPMLQPIFSSRELDGEITIKPGQILVMGGLTGEEFVDGVSRKVIYCLIMQREKNDSR